MMISYENGINKFQYRAASIVLKHNYVLLQRQKNDYHWFIPGGRVEFNETAESTIEREMNEEFSVSITDKKIIWIVENFIEYPDKRVHEIGIFFLVNLPEHHTIYLHETEFEGTEDGFLNKWVSIDCLDDYKIVPEFVVPELKGLDVNKGIKHVINRVVR
jgi:ADP-ribose pyrophosphatase YjhB (NUDIX family)